MPDKNPVYFPVGCTLKTFTAHDLSERISWSPDGTRIAGGSNDGTIKILDVESGAVLRSFGTSEPRSLLRRFFATTQLNLTRVETHSVAWSPDGSTIAVCLDQKLRAWQVETGEQLWECNLRTALAPIRPTSTRAGPTRSVRNRTSDLQVIESNRFAKS